MDEPAKAALALSRAQPTQVYAGLKLWPDAVVARLAEAQLVADGTYPNAAAVFGGRMGGPDIDGGTGTVDFSPAQSRRTMGERRAPDGAAITLTASADDPKGLEAAKAASRAADLNRAQQRGFHDAIAGQGITGFQEPLEMARSVRRGGCS